MLREDIEEILAGKAVFAKRKLGRLHFQRSQGSQPLGRRHLQPLR